MAYQPPGHTASSSLEQPLPGARAALLLLIAINLFNYIDRQVLAAVLPKLEQSLFTKEDSAVGTKLGLLTTAFMVSYTLLSPLFGWLGDRVSRWLLVGLGITVWSLASGASGLAGPVSFLSAFAVMFLTRCFVGIGEAAYGPVAPTLISDLYPARIRGSVLAWFYMAIPVGGALGYLLGGLVADSAWLVRVGVDPLECWRWAFSLVVPPGLLLGLMCFLMREPRRGQADFQHAAAVRRPGWKDYRVLLHTPSYVLNTLGMTAMTFTVGGVATWMPTYIYEREARFQVTDKTIQALREQAEPIPEEVLAKLEPLRYQRFSSLISFENALTDRLSPPASDQYGQRIANEAREVKLGLVNTVFGAIVVISGLTATLLGGIIGDRLRDRLPGAYFLVSGVGMLLGLPMFLLILVTPLPWSWAFIFLAVFCLFFNTGPTNTILANVTHPATRATGFAVNIFVIHALGDVISPPIIGGLRDLFKAQGHDTGRSLEYAFAIVSIMVLVSGILWLAGAKYLARDTARAPSSLDG